MRTRLPRPTMRRTSPRSSAWNSMEARIPKRSGSGTATSGLLWLPDLTGELPVAPIDEPTGDGREQDQRVGDDEDPFAHEQGVHGEAERRGDLTAEEPLRDSFIAALAPLLVDLLAERRQKNDRAQPSENPSHGV